jgi:hypothetical protein
MTVRERFAIHAAAIWLMWVFSTAFTTAAVAFDWAPYREDSTVEIITLDEDGSPRETRIWIVVVDEFGFIRTNDSKWLGNIRRDPAIRLRTRDVTADFAAEEIDDPAVYDRVEQAFKEKYGWMQKVMSAFRMSRPTVLRISPSDAAAPGAAP